MKFVSAIAVMMIAATPTFGGGMADPITESIRPQMKCLKRVENGNYFNVVIGSRCVEDRREGSKFDKPRVKREQDHVIRPTPIEPDSKTDPEGYQKWKEDRDRNKVKSDNSNSNGKGGNVHDREDKAQEPSEKSESHGKSKEGK